MASAICVPWSQTPALPISPWGIFNSTRLKPVLVIVLAKVVYLLVWNETIWMDSLGIFEVASLPNSSSNPQWSQILGARWCRSCNCSWLPERLRQNLSMGGLGEFQGHPVFYIPRMLCVFPFFGGWIDGQSGIAWTSFLSCRIKTLCKEIISTTQYMCRSAN